MKLARATLSAGRNTLVMPVNPYSAQWGYQENAISYDTLGGRVIQLLSVQITGLTVDSVAGSRKELQKVAESARAIMEYHVSTLQPAIFVVPSRKWKFRVYLTSMPQMGWDVASTTYPYNLQFQIDEDINGVKSHQVELAALSRLYRGIGYSPEVHGGDYKAFSKTVKTLLSAGALSGVSVGGGGGGGGTATGGTWQGRGLWNPKISNAPWTGKTLKDQIYNAWRAVFGSQVATRMVCIAERESSFTPDVWNSYGSPIHYVYGIYQISDVHSAASWWPQNGVHGTEGGLMYDAEYNVRCAMSLYQASLGGPDPWASTASGCPGR